MGERELVILIIVSGAFPTVIGLTLLMILERSYYYPTAPVKCRRSSAFPEMDWEQTPGLQVLSVGLFSSETSF